MMVMRQRKITKTYLDASVVVIVAQQSESKSTKLCNLFLIHWAQIFLTSLNLDLEIDGGLRFRVVRRFVSVTRLTLLIWVNVPML